MKEEPLPQIYLVRDVNLAEFAYKLHIFAGDFLGESEFNLRSFATNTSLDSIAIMGKRHMWLSDAVLATALRQSSTGWPSQRNISEPGLSCSMRSGRRTGGCLGMS